ncbi:hypothetical protein CYMTET_36879 [Cymbomonas tetramitiformis]|uniref:Methyltransferase domain-containing protein n=1 Tax=Cymbomonas tetramitiformis TaxID=36881 RepID=A0AAE0CGM3_9CHLO|nr:hypothetical protein CYMTET_36879 [Cymbomonas tetramitiformis]
MACLRNILMKFRKPKQVAQPATVGSSSNCLLFQVSYFLRLLHLLRLRLHPCYPNSLLLLLVILTLAFIFAGTREFFIGHRVSGKETANSATISNELVISGKETANSATISNQLVISGTTWYEYDGLDGVYYIAYSNPSVLHFDEVQSKEECATECAKKGATHCPGFVFFAIHPDNGDVSGRCFGTPTIEPLLGGGFWSNAPVVTAYLDHAQIASPPAIQASAQLSAEVSASLATLSELVLSSDPPYKCLHKVRVGTQADGGWFICADIKPKRDCVVYSVGIANDYSFDVEFGRRYGCKVYSFDPTISHPHKLSRDADVRFFQFGMAGVNNFGRGMPVVTIPYAMKLLGHRRIDVLKIDCEGCELSVLENMRKAAPQVLDHVEQVLVEFHLSTTLGMNSTESILLLATIFRWLSDRGFLLFHKSLNNGFLQDQHVYPDLLLSGFPPRTCCVELCFVSRRAVHRAQAGGALVSSVSPSADEGNYFGRDDWSKPLFKGLRLTEQAAGAIVDLGLQPGAAACRAACAQYELNRCRSFQWGADYPAVVSSDHQMKCLGRTDDTWAPVQANGYVSGIIPENFRTMWFYQETGLYSRRDEVQTDLVGYAHSTDIFWLQNRTQDAPITVEPSRKQPVAAYLIILSQQDLEMLLSTLQSMDAYLMGRMRAYPILIYTTQAWPSELYQAVKVAAGDLASQMRVTSLEETGNKPAVLFSKVVQMQAEAGMEYFMHLKPGSVFTSELGSTSDLFHWMEDHQVKFAYRSAGLSKLEPHRLRSTLDFLSQQASHLGFPSRAPRGSALRFISSVRHGSISRLPKIYTHFEIFDVKRFSESDIVDMTEAGEKAEIEDGILHYAVIELLLRNEEKHRFCQFGMHFGNILSIGTNSAFFLSKAIFSEIFGGKKNRVCGLGEGGVANMAFARPLLDSGQVGGRSLVVEK